MKSYRLLLILNICCLLIINSSCQDKKPVEQVESPYPAVKIIQHNTPFFYDFAADIQGIENVEVRARVRGYLEKILVDEGQKITQGTVMFQIEDKEFLEQISKAKANVSQAQSSAAAAKVEVNRLRPLVEQDIISKTELEAADAQYAAALSKIQEAKAALNNAQINYSYTKIKAPVTGFIDRIPYKEGSLISESTLLTTVSNVSNVYAYFNVSEKAYLEYTRRNADLPDSIKEKRNKVDLILADGNKYAHTGVIETIEGQFNKETGAIGVRARFPNPDTLLRSNTSGRIRIYREQDDALLLPLKSTFEIQDKIFVYVLNEKDSTVQVRNIIPKRRVSYFYIVESGIKEGEHIIYEGAQNLTDSAKINYYNISMDSLIEAAPWE
ncbi:efflux RND transporter periplasmic adaptor subunit [Algivirga pacifica]|uniref:Efflux RND transporter periplasmic adaptor subunit n=1 Tax=Algivirga pacifica TaxID=1162670 RepID=A0ABP9DCN0_9BACT